jgi:hypothetical protein
VSAAIPDDISEYEEESASVSESESASEGASESEMDLEKNEESDAVSKFVHPSLDSYSRQAQIADCLRY